MMMGTSRLFKAVTKYWPTPGITKMLSMKIEPVMPNAKVTGKEVAELLTQLTDTEIDKKKVELANPIKQTGEFVVPIKLYTDVVAELKVKVTV